MPRLIAAILCLCTVVYTLPAAALAQVRLGADSAFVFASRELAIDILTADDDYTARMSQFDRMLRLKSAAPVTPQQYRKHLAANTMAWTGAERERLRPLLQRLSNTLADYLLPLPPEVVLIKTTGQAEIGDGYTRGNAIVLPLHSLAEDDETLYFLLAHELFHVMSRHDARFRAQAYALVGFRIGPEIKLPNEIAPLQITNPDAPRHDSFIDVRIEGRKITVVPILLSRSAVFDPEIGDVLDRYWTFRLMVVAQSTAGSTPVAQMQNGAPVLLRVKQVEGFLEQIGRNTRYIIHAEEVLAENFAFLATSKEVAEPERIEALRQLLTRYGALTEAAGS